MGNVCGTPSPITRPKSVGVWVSCVDAVFAHKLSTPSTFLHHLQIIITQHKVMACKPLLHHGILARGRLLVVLTMVDLTLVNSHVTFSAWLVESVTESWQSTPYHLIFLPVSTMKCF